jgi:mannose-6-phosphate isomerase-like protein (cupin superfamily)
MKMEMQPKLFAHDAGKTMQIGRMTFYPKMTAEDTQGAYTIVEAVVPPDSGSGLHRHWSYDEAALVTEGRFECLVDGKPVIVGAGESVYWPRGTAHKLRCVGPGVGRILFVCSPGRIFEDFMQQIATPKVDGGNAVSGPAVDLRAIAARLGIEFLD